MRHRFTVSLGACLIALSYSAQAEFYSGIQLKSMLEQWRQGTSSVDAWIGEGYVLGVHDVLSGRVVCSPKEVTPTDVTATALVFMRSNPEILNHTADDVVARSLKAAYPCGSAYAKYWRANAFQPKLQDWEGPNTVDQQDATIAAGYMVGVYDAAQGVVICSPASVTNRQLTSILLKFMRQNPEILDQWADRIILQSLGTLWPCPATRTSSGATSSGASSPLPQPQPQAARPTQKLSKPKAPPPTSDTPF